MESIQTVIVAFGIVMMIAAGVGLALGDPAKKARNMLDIYLLRESMKHRDDPICFYCDQPVPQRHTTLYRGPAHWANCPRAPEIVHYAWVRAEKIREAAGG